jgi:integrase/recombinase XerD
MVTLREVTDASRTWANYRGKYRHIAPGPVSEPTFAWLAKRWLHFHRKLVLPSVNFAFAKQLDEYGDFMRSAELAPFTVKTRIYQTRRFLQWFSKRRRKRHLRTLSLNDVDKYFTVNANKWSSVSLSSCAATLRAFFLYAESRRWCRNGIAQLIKGPPVRPVASGPYGPKWEDVLRLLRATKGGDRIALRARAILLLISFYALRRSEIIRLRLNDFDWRAGVFTIRRSKHGGLQQFPLCRDVSDSIGQYILRARPISKSDRLFVSFHPPFGPMCPVSINVIVSSRLKRLQIKSKRYGPHALRHACATELLRRGSSLQAIADILGHRTHESVGVYAKFDLKALQKVSGLDLAGKL